MEINTMFNKKTICLLSFLLLFSNSVLPQNIIKRNKQYVLADIGPDSGIKIGDQISVYRNSANGQDLKIGLIKIVRFQAGKCAGQVINENIGNPINSGDFLKLTPNQKDNTLSILNEENSPIQQPSKQIYTSKTSYQPKYLSLGAGLLTCGLGYYFNQKANKIFDDYKKAKTADDATRLYNDTVKYDKITNITIGVGAGLVVWGVISPIFKSHSASDQTISFNIYTNYNKIQIAMNIPLTKIVI
jgi:hypothetical protein